MHKKYVFFIGTNAELVKMFPVIKTFNEAHADVELIASGQNDITTSPLLAIADKTTIDVVLSSGVNTQSTGNLFLWFIQTVIKGYKVLKERYKYTKYENESTTHVMLVHGDTVSSVMGAILGKLLGFKVAHVEAGLRSYNMFNPFPEEIDRQIVSFFADSHFCPNSWAVANLKHAHGKKVNTQQNTLYESLKLAQSNAVPASESQKFFILVMHRQENLFNAEFIDYVIKTITEVSATMKCLFVMHPLTKATLSKLGLLETVQNNANIQVVSNVPYVEFMQILARAEFLLTDGGSNQEEAYYLGKPCLILRKATERIEGLHENVVLYNGNGDFIKDFVADYQKYNRPKLEVAVEPSKIILSELEAL